MSKKQAIINKFFQPKAKDYVLSSEPLRIKPRSFQGVRNIQNVRTTSAVISLLSSDEEDEVTSVNKENVNDSNASSEKTQSNLANQTVNETLNEVSTSTIDVASTEISLTDKSEDSVVTSDFVDVVLQVENGSNEKMGDPASKEQFTDYKLSSFLSMIDWVLNDESNYHLFNEDDWTVIENFKSMSGTMEFMQENLTPHKIAGVVLQFHHNASTSDCMCENIDGLELQKSVIPKSETIYKKCSTNWLSNVYFYHVN